MANANIPAPKPSGKSRILWVIIAFVILLIAIGAGVLYIEKRGAETAYSAAHLRHTPSITSTPGVGKPSKEYVKNIKAENIRRAQEAARVEGSSVPTLITRPGGVISTAEESKSESEQISGAKEPPAIPPQGCDPQELARARLAGVHVDELRCKGCDASHLKEAGYTAGNLRAAGLTAKELHDAGYTARDLKEGGYSAQELKDGGFSANELKTVGYSAGELRAAGYTAANVTNAGFTALEMEAAGYDAGEVKMGGFSVTALKNAGYTAADLKKAGFNGLDLKEAGFAPPELVAGGLTDEELHQAGLSTAQITRLRAEIGPRRVPNECRASELRHAELQGISASEIKKKINCSAAALREADYTVEELKTAGYSTKEIKEAGFSDKELGGGGFSPSELRSAGVSALALKSLGYTAGDLARAGYPPADLVKLGFSASQLRAAGVDPASLKLAGMRAIDLKLAGFSDGELLRAGFATAEISPTQISITPAPGVSLPAPGVAPTTAVPVPVFGPGLLPGQIPGAITTPTPVSGVAPATAAPPSPGLVPGQVTVPLTTPIPVTSPAPAPSPSTAPQASAMEAEIAPLVRPLPDQDQRMQDVLKRMQSKQENRLSQQQRQEMLKAVQSSMANQAGDLFGSWSPPSNQQYVRGEKDKDEGKAGAGQGGGPQAMGPGAGAGGQAGGANGENVIKAGTIMFAVLDTGINSDEQSPILATIAQGPLKGAKLLGQFSRVNKKVVLSFNVLSVPSLPNSLTVNAVAIDPDTARTAIASSVDSHYMLRYGTLFASTFLAGLGEAVLQSGATTVDAPFGQSTTQNPTTSITEKGLIALGNVGNQYARTLGQNFQRPPTVKVNAGAGIGILIMADLNVPGAVSVTQTNPFNPACTTANPCTGKV